MGVRLLVVAMCVLNATAARATQDPEGAAVVYAGTLTSQQPVTGALVGDVSTPHLHDFWEVAAKVGQLLAFTATRAASSDIHPNFALYPTKLAPGSIAPPPPILTSNESSPELQLSYTALATGPLTLVVGSDDLVNPNDGTQAGGSYALRLTICGDGVLEPGEVCDDGNNRANDCCSPTCTFEPLGTSCDDQNALTGNDQCEGEGTCRGLGVAVESEGSNRLVCTLVDPSGSAKAECRVRGFPEPASGAVAPAARGIEILRRVTIRFKGKTTRARLKLALNDRGKRLLRQQGTLRARVEIDVADRQGRTRLLARLLEFLRKAR